MEEQFLVFTNDRINIKKIYPMETGYVLITNDDKVVMWGYANGMLKM